MSTHTARARAEQLAHASVRHDTECDLVFNSKGSCDCGAGTLRRQLAYAILAYADEIRREERARCAQVARDFVVPHYDDRYLGPALPLAEAEALAAAILTEPSVD